MKRPGRTRLIYVALVFMAVAIAIAIFGRGNVGPESVAHKELADFVAQAAAEMDASVASEASVDPSSIALPSALELKRRLKRLLSRVGVTYPLPERATEFLVRSNRGPEQVRCLALCRGDAVTGIVVVYNEAQSAFADRLRAALESKFAGYKVQESRSGA